MISSGHLWDFPSSQLLLNISIAEKKIFVASRTVYLPAPVQNSLPENKKSLTKELQVPVLEREAGIALWLKVSFYLCIS